MVFVVFPHDLITEILQLLPVKTLLRFKSVSRLLYGTINSTGFINSHLRNNKNTHHQIILWDEEKRLDHHTNNLVGCYVFDMNDPFPPNEPESKLESGYHVNNIIHYPLAQCNGLVLLREVCPCSRFVIWNPSTRKCWELPLLPGMMDRVMGWGFFYDSSVDDYKIVLIKYDHINYRSEIWILGLLRTTSGGNYWRKIENFPDDKIDSLWHSASNNCIVDGVFYFLFMGKNDGCFKIYAFDLAKETFSRISLPKRNMNLYPKLLVLGGCLCFRASYRKGFYVWKKKKKKNHGGEFSWTKLKYSINEEIRFETLLELSKDQGKKVFDFVDQSATFFYDFEEQSIKEIYTCDQNVFLNSVESLVSIDYPEL